MLKAQLKKSRKFIKKYKPIGFRAPEMKLDPDNLDILQTNGFK